MKRMDCVQLGGRDAGGLNKLIQYCAQLGGSHGAAGLCPAGR